MACVNANAQPYRNGECDAPDRRRPATIHIIGGPGSGKTTLARRLAERSGAPAFELDAIAEQGGMGLDFRIVCPLAKRLADVDAIVDLPCWVTEGSYLWWTDRLLHAADIIVWLDIPWHIGVRRIITRHMREYVADVASQVTMRERLRVLRYPHVRHLIAFVPYTWKYYTRPPQPENVDDGYALTRAGAARHLEKYDYKVIRCTRPPEIASLLNTVTEIRGASATSTPVTIRTVGADAEN